MKKYRKKIEDEPHSHVLNNSKSENEQCFLAFRKKGGDVFLKNVRVVVEDIGNRHENVVLGFRIKEELQEDAKEMLKNMLEI